MVVVKLIFIAFIMMMTGPVATHALAHAAWVGGLNPLLGKELRHADIAPETEDLVAASNLNDGERN